MSCNLIQIVVAILAAYPGAQPTKSQVQNLAHFDTIPAGTSFTDVDGRTYGMTGSTTMSVTAEKTKFGAAALKFIDSAYMSLGRSTADCFGTGDFTIELWVNPKDFVGPRGSGYQGLVNMTQATNGSSGGLAIWLGPNGNVALDFGTTTVINSAANALTAQQWNHIAVTRHGTLFTLWINGVSFGTYVTAGFNHVESYDYLGWSYIAAHGGGYFAGYMDELRIVKGLAVYTANFTPQSTAYTMPTA